MILLWQLLHFCIVLTLQLYTALDYLLDCPAAIEILLLVLMAVIRAVPH